MPTIDPQDFVTFGAACTCSFLFIMFVGTCFIWWRLRNEDGELEIFPSRSTGSQAGPSQQDRQPIESHISVATGAAPPDLTLDLDPEAAPELTLDLDLDPEPDPEPEPEPEPEPLSRPHIEPASIETDRTDNIRAIPKKSDDDATTARHRNQSEDEESPTVSRDIPRTPLGVTDRPLGIDDPPSNSSLLTPIVVPDDEESPTVIIDRNQPFEDDDDEDST